VPSGALDVLRHRRSRGCSTKSIESGSTRPRCGARRASPGAIVEHAAAARAANVQPRIHASQLLSAFLQRPPRRWLYAMTGPTATFPFPRRWLCGAAGSDTWWGRLSHRSVLQGGRCCPTHGTSRPRSPDANEQRHEAQRRAHFSPQARAPLARSFVAIAVAAAAPILELVTSSSASGIITSASTS